MKSFDRFNRDNSIEELLDNRIISLDFVDFILGERLGSGCYRDVYVYNPDPSLVIKIDVGNTFANVGEFWNWTQLEECKKVSQWLAPVVSCSSTGKILLQKRCKPLKEFPKLIPSFFTDVKFDNWGLYKGRPVCFDYSLIPNNITKVELIDSSKKLPR